MVVKMSDVIAAISTPPGQGGVGIVRISGDGSLGIMKKVFSHCPEDPAPRHVYFGHVVDPDKTGPEAIIDEAVFIYMKAPHSYTCEDVVEIQAHGGPVGLKKILRTVIRNGARLAEPGEFTKLAFMNGRLDLTQAEAVMDIISAKTDLPYTIAESQLEGSLGRRIREIRQGLLDVLAQMAVNIDFPDEDIEEMEYDAFIRDVSREKDSIASFINSAPTGRITREGVKVAIVGSPNAGKSSLLNGLLGEERAIVTDVPGTTRDTIQEMMDIGGMPVVLEDTAGIRDTRDQVEQIGIDRSRKALQRADVVLFVVDGSRPLRDEDRYIARAIKDCGKESRTITILNKEDLSALSGEADIGEILDDPRVIQTSLLEGKDLDISVEKVSQEIERMIFAVTGSQIPSAVVTSERQLDALERAYEQADSAVRMLMAGEALEICELGVHSAYDILGEIIGEKAGDQILNAVFSKFCLGK